MLKEMIDGMTHLLYPRLCYGCSKSLLPEEDILCLNCSIYNLPRTAYHHIPENETASRLAGRFPFEKATTLAYFTHEGLLQHLLHGLKYDGKTEIGSFLGKQLGYDLQLTGWANGIEVIIPVPLHIDKEKLRGYNQSTVIAEGVGEVLNIPVFPQALTRIRNTESQTQKSREERISNMEDAFAVPNATILEGKHILLIDDVLTTGATLEACALALLKVPGLRISFATIGIAV